MYTTTMQFNSATQVKHLLGFRPQHFWSDEPHSNMLVVASDMFKGPRITAHALFSAASGQVRETIKALIKALIVIGRTASHAPSPLRSSSLALEGPFVKHQISEHQTISRGVFSRIRNLPIPNRMVVLSGAGADWIVSSPRCQTPTR